MKQQRIRYNNERNILKNLDNNENIKTTIIVSHRFETLKMCDKLYFIENGKVEELKFRRINF